MYYKLDENNNVVSSSLEEWSNFIERRPGKSIHVGDDEIGEIRISTVFLGLDHNYHSNNEMIHVFETMVFDEKGRDIYMMRYSTYKEAEEGHQRALEWVKNGCKEEDN